MEKIGIICEYNPFHNGHLYHLEKIKEKYPDSIIILALNGAFMQRGEISIINKFAKTSLALKFGVDLVIELPTLFGTQSADTFAYTSVKLLNELKVDRIVFGSECNDVDKLSLIAEKSLEKEHDKEIKELLDQGINYPTALAKSLNIDFNFLSNDLLGISYIKAIKLINNKIIPETIQRTNNYLDIKSNDKIVSASNIREKLKNKENISKYLPQESLNEITSINTDLFYKLLKSIIIRSDNLNEYLDVEEGIEYRLIKGITSCDSLNEFIDFVKTKRYTYNKINRMLIHILLGIKKTDAQIEADYLKILGFNQKGQEYLTQIKKEVTLPLINKKSKIYEYELKAAIFYDLLTNNNTYKKELSNKPIIY